jgi:hypothetical protein
MLRYTFPINGIEMRIYWGICVTYEPYHWLFKYTKSLWYPPEFFRGLNSFNNFKYNFTSVIYLFNQIQNYYNLT